MEEDKQERMEETKPIPTIENESIKKREAKSDIRHQSQPSADQLQCDTLNGINVVVLISELLKNRFHSEKLILIHIEKTKQNWKFIR